MQFYFRQFSADECVIAMDLDAIGAHILLICAAGASPQGYKIRNDERAIRTIIRNKNGNDWTRIKSQLLAGAWKISSDKKWWVQNGMKRSFMKQKVFRDEQKRKSKLANDARWKHPRGDDSGTLGGSPSHPSSSSPASASSSAIQSQSLLARASSDTTEHHEAETARASPPTPSEVQKAITKTAKQLSPTANRNGGLRAHIEAGIFRKKTENAYFDATHAGMPAADCIRQAVQESAFSLLDNRGVELKGITYTKLADLAWSKISASTAAIEAMQNFDIRSRQVVAVSVRCVTDAAMEFLQKGNA